MPPRATTHAAQAPCAPATTMPPSTAATAPWTSAATTKTPLSTKGSDDSGRRLVSAAGERYGARGIGRMLASTTSDVEAALARAHGEHAGGEVPLTRP